MNVLVTGGCGYVGSALLPHLQAAEEVDRLTVLDNLSTGTPRNLFGIDVADEFAFRSGDVRNYGDVENAVRDADAVIHLAAITGAASTHDRPEETRAVNYEGTKNVLTAAEKFGIGNVVFASSCNSYGRAASEDIDESVEPAPINPYAETKHDSESLLCEFVSSTGADATALRMSTNYGLAPGIRFNLVVNHFVFRALTGRPLTVYGDGSNWRPFIHVRDAARAFAHAALSPERWSHLVYNVGSNDENYRIAEVARVVRDEIDADLDVTYLQDEHPGPSYHINFDRLAETGFETRYTLPRGVRELAEAFSESRKGTLEGEGMIEP